MAKKANIKSKKTSAKTKVKANKKDWAELRAGDGKR